MVINDRKFLLYKYNLIRRVVSQVLINTIGGIRVEGTLSIALRGIFFLIKRTSHLVSQLVTNRN